MQVCQNYLTTGTGYVSLIHKEPKENLKKKDGTYSDYTQLKYKEIQKYFGNSSAESAYNVQVYFKRCGARIQYKTDKEHSEVTFSNFVKFAYPSIDVDRQSFSKTLLKKLDKSDRKLFPCPVCFQIGVTEAYKILGHMLKKTRAVIFYGFAYALKCAVEKLNTGKERLHSLRQGKDKAFYWEDANNNVCSHEGNYYPIYCCDKCIRRRQNLLKKDYVCDIDAFNSFKHLNSSFGKKVSVSDALSTLCSCIGSKSQNKYTVGENVTSIYLRENVETATLEVVLPPAVNDAKGDSDIETEVATKLTGLNQSGSSSSSTS